MTYRLAAIDLDATLLDRTGRISEPNAAALRRIAETGVVVAPATARWYRAAISQFARIGLDVAALSSGGADVRLAGGEVVEQRTCPAEFGLFIADLCDGAGWPANISTRSHTYRRDAVVPEWAARAPEWITPVSRLAGLDLSDIVSALITVREDDRSLAAFDAWRGQINLNRAIAFTGEILLTVTAAGVDKGSGLLALCRALDIPPEEAVAFGDSEVDLPMFQVAGLSVAMANGTPHIRAAATMTTASADEDGVAKALAQIWPER